MTRWPLSCSLYLSTVVMRIFHTWLLITFKV